MAPGQNEIASTIRRSALSLNTGSDFAGSARHRPLFRHSATIRTRVVARRPLKPQRLRRIGRSIGVEALRASVAAQELRFRAVRRSRRRVCDVRVELLPSCYRRGEEWNSESARLSRRYGSQQRRL